MQFESMEDKALHSSDISDMLDLLSYTISKISCEVLNYGLFIYKCDYCMWLVSYILTFIKLLLILHKDSTRFRWKLKMQIFVCIELMQFNHFLSQ